jgi:formylglycine-generating enzyme required for sulfatase activity
MREDQVVETIRHCNGRLRVEGIMKNRLAIVAVVICSVLTAARGADAADEGETDHKAPRRWALVIGVDKFISASPLTYCSRDALAMKQQLIVAGFPEDNIILLYDGTDRREAIPFQSNIERALENLFVGELQLDGTRSEPLVRRGDTIVIVFSGHGMHVDGRSYLCPADGHWARRGSLIGLEQVFQMLANSPAAAKLMIMDACRNDPRPPAARPAASGELARSLKDPPKGIWVLSSCAPGQRSWENHQLGHAVFFYYVLEGLRGAADGSGNRRVSVSELYEYTLERTEHFVRQRENEQQTPILGLPQRVINPEDRVEFATVDPPITNSVGMKLVPIPPGSFLMGSPLDEPGRDRDELPHPVQITKKTYMGQFEVTQAQFQEVMGENPSHFRPNGPGPDRVTQEDAGRMPVESVTWIQANEFCGKLSNLPQERMAGRQYRLPTEAEWEYSCRAGTQTACQFGKELLPVQANFDYGDHSPGRPEPVGTYAANDFGLHDMHGNVREWCLDLYDETFYRDAPQTNPLCAGGMGQVFRGGSYETQAAKTRSAYRAGFGRTIAHRDLGFRVACTVVPPE